jgi:cytochrome d ubiquinol oxidase subunit II
VLCGVVALGVLATHGAHYLVLRTGGEVAARARVAARFGTRLLPFLTAASLAGTLVVRPGVLANFRAHAIGLALPALVLASLFVMERARRADHERTAFGASCVYIIAMLGGAAFALYPVLLPSSGDPARALTITSAATSQYALRVGLTWWIVAAIIVVASFRFLYRSFRGKILPGSGGYGDH